MSVFDDLFQKITALITAFLMTLFGFGGAVKGNDAIPEVASGAITLGSVPEQPVLNDTPIVKAGAAVSPSLKSISSFGNTNMIDKFTDSVKGGTYFYACGTDSLAGFSLSFIVKYDSSGNQIWKKVISEGNGQTALSGITYTNGNALVVCGYVSSSASGSSSPDRNAVVMKYDLDGNRVWKKVYKGSENDHFSKICALTDGGTVVCGKTYSVDGSFDGIPDYGYSCGFLMRLDKDGNRVWMRYLGASGASDVSDIDSDTSNNIFISASSFASDGDFGAFKNSVANSLDNYIVKYNKDGVMQWNYTLSSNYRDYFDCVAADGSGGCYAGGFFANTGGNNFITAGTLAKTMIIGGNDAYVVSISAYGVKKWDVSLGGSLDDTVNSISKEGNYIAVSGYTNSYSGTFPTNEGGSDAFVTLINTSGNIAGTVMLGGSESDAAACCTYADSVLTVFGYSASQDGDFDGINTTATVNTYEFYDCFVAQYDL